MWISRKGHGISGNGIAYSDGNGSSDTASLIGHTKALHRLAKTVTTRQRQGSTDRSEERCGETRCVVTPTATARYLISRSAPLFGCTSVPYQLSRDRKTMSKEFSTCSSIPGMIHDPDLLSSSSKSYQIMIIKLIPAQLKETENWLILIMNSSST